MNKQLELYLDDLYRHGLEHDANKADRLERLRNVEPETARLLAVLVCAVGAKRLLELGTSNGYSTLWLADAARRVGGRVLSVDIDPARSAVALENLSNAQLQGYVELRTEDAALTLGKAVDASVDMIFLDAERPAYCDYWQHLPRVLRLGGLLVVDNVLSHAAEVQAFRRLVEEEDGVTESLVPIGAGVLLVVKYPG
ncbi:MAG TPA: class I SAM-dependent methyltransferase [Solirubrobacteraceae bacterium]|jgi:predicted O-methyltransferase YrrM|nr:class I SAM-dependent methyltransferase [Solirubrobacteraceae bacterium]